MNCMQIGIPCFGPRMQAAQIESSKDFSKQFMSRFSLPTAKWRAFVDADEACQFIRRLRSYFILVLFIFVDIPELIKNVSNCKLS